MIVFNIVFTLFMPELKILCGYLMYKHTPKDINCLVGYRTAMSMKNQETWDFAHNYCGRLWVKVGAVMTIISALVCVPYCFMSSGNATVIMCIAEVIQVVVFCWTIVPTERALKDNFDQDPIKVDINDLDKYFVKSELTPAIAFDVDTKTVLMLAYMNKESLKKTLETGYTWYWSRSRQEYWNKGATSGHLQKAVSIYADCDNDTLLLNVKQTGVACHTGSYSCFFNEIYNTEEE